MKVVTDEDDLVLMTENGIIMRISASSLRAMGRATQGVRLMNVKEGDRLVTVDRSPKEEVDEEVVAEGPGAGGDLQSDAPEADDDVEEPGGAEAETVDAPQEDLEDEIEASGEEDADGLEDSMESDPERPDPEA
jgi:DNA gyrase subunit A